MRQNCVRVRLVNSMITADGVRQFYMTERQFDITFTTIEILSRRNNSIPTSLIHWRRNNCSFPSNIFSYVRKRRFTPSCLVTSNVEKCIFILTSHYFLGYGYDGSLVYYTCSSVRGESITAKIVAHCKKKEGKWKSFGEFVRLKYSVWRIDLMENVLVQFSPNFLIVNISWD